MCESLIIFMYVSGALNEPFLKNYYNKKQVVSAKEKELAGAKGKESVAVIQQLENELAEAKKAAQKAETEKKTNQFLHYNLRVLHI